MTLDSHTKGNQIEDIVLMCITGDPNAIIKINMDKCNVLSENFGMFGHDIKREYTISSLTRRYEKIQSKY